MKEKIDYKANFELYVNDEKIGDLNTLKRLVPEKEFNVIMNNISKGEKEGTVCFERLKAKNFTYKFEFEGNKEFNKIPVADRKAIMNDIANGKNVGSKEINTLSLDEKRKLIKVNNKNKEEER